MFKKSPIIFFGLIISFSISSCSVFVPHNQTLKIDTSPPNSQVWVNSSYKGLSPVQMETRRDKDVYIMIKKEGYETGLQTVSNHLSVTGILDIIGACILIVPAAGLATPGARALDETDIYVNLAEIKQ